MYDYYEMAEILYRSQLDMDSADYDETAEKTIEEMASELEELAAKDTTIYHFLESMAEMAETNELKSMKGENS